VYLDGKGAELATIGEVGVVIFVTVDGDLVVAVGVDIVVDEVGRSMTVLFVLLLLLGELKSNDNRDL
jgi:hypothetical protein